MAQAILSEQRVAPYLHAPADRPYRAPGLDWPLPVPASTSLVLTRENQFG
jgi:hypothetical protein